MEFILTNLEIFNLFESLNDIKKENNKIFGDIGYKILMNYQILFPYYKKIVQKRDQIIKQYKEEQEINELLEEDYKKIREKIVIYEKEKNKINLFYFTYNDLKKIKIKLSNLEDILKIVA